MSNGTYSPRNGGKYVIRQKEKVLNEMEKDLIKGGMKPRAAYALRKDIEKFIDTTTSEYMHKFARQSRDWIISCYRDSLKTWYSKVDSSKDHRHWIDVFNATTFSQKTIREKNHIKVIYYIKIHSSKFNVNPKKNLTKWVERHQDPKWLNRHNYNSGSALPSSFNQEDFFFFGLLGRKWDEPDNVVIPPFTVMPKIYSWYKLNHDVYKPYDEGYLNPKYPDHKLEGLMNYFGMIKTSATIDEMKRSNRLAMGATDLQRRFEQKVKSNNLEIYDLLR